MGFGIPFAFVATHNHFVLDRGGKVFKQSAPVIKLPANATLDDHLDLLGLLNSSSLAFWMRQVFHDKGNGGIGGGIASEDWERFYEYDSTKLQRAPIVTRDRAARIALAQALDATAQARAACVPEAVLASSAWTPDTLALRLEAAREQYLELTHRMVALQEELDWLTYGSYGLLEGHSTRGPDALEPLAPGHRPFEILLALHDEEADEDEKTAWFTRHCHDRVTGIPGHYSAATAARIQARMALIEESPTLQMLEQPAHKRRWQTPDLLEEAKKGAERWLLDRLEDLFAPARDAQSAGSLSTPRPYRLEEIVAALRPDPRVVAVAAVLEGTVNVDLEALCERLLRGQALPDNVYRIYSDEGMRKWRQWQKVWHLQDLEDQGRPLVDPESGEALQEVPLPPKFAQPDFQRADYYKLRGKLNVPRERFILFDDLTPDRFGWNGWRDLERTLAQVEAFTEVEKDPERSMPPPTSSDPRRCGSTLGLWESLPDLKRWGDAAQHEELRSLAQEVCGQAKCPCDVVKSWQSWQKTGRMAGQEEGLEVQAEVTLEERAALSQVLVLPGARGATFMELLQQWAGTRERLEAALEDLIATGNIAVSGRGKGKRFAWRG